MAVSILMEDPLLQTLPSKEQIQQLPIFQNLPLQQIQVIHSLQQCHAIEQELKMCTLFGFDSESKPTFNKGEVSTGPHLIQLASRDKAYLFQISPAILEFLKPIFENKNQIKPNTSSTDKNEKNTKINKKSNSMQKISDINILGTIKNGDKVAYTLEVTKVIDVTEEAKNKSINDSNYLDFYSSNQAKQAVSITIKISNSSGKTISAPFLDDIKIKDSAGITNVGGWKNENSSSTEFGTYQLDNEYKTKKENYEVENDETKLVTSTVLLATPSERINFIFTSELYNDEIQFDLPVSKQ